MDAFSKFTTEQRQNIMRKQGISCDCLACKKDWGGEASMKELKKKMKLAFTIKKTMDEQYLKSHMEMEFDGVLKDKCEEFADIQKRLTWDQYEVWRSLHKYILYNMLLYHFCIPMKMATMSR